MKVLNLNTELKASKAFNSFLWKEEFAKKGIKLEMLVNEINIPGDIDVDLISKKSNQKIESKLGSILSNYQFRRGLQNRFIYENGEIFGNSKFIESDIIHLHLTNPNSISLKRIHEISLRKPLVWTWHDPWPLTGHCIYPDKCKEWDNFCRTCPDLSRGFAVGRDRTLKNRSEKYSLFAEIDMNIHVSSEWMLNLINQSGINLMHEPKIIPLPSIFTFDNRYLKRDTFRAKHQIRGSEIVIGFRDSKQFQKNLRIIESIFIRLKESDNLILVSIDDTGFLKQFSEKFRIIELGNLYNVGDLEEFYQGIDLFLSMSTSEAYGMMAAEAISLGTPCMVVKGTATSEIVQKYGGIEILDMAEGLQYIESLICDPLLASRKLANLVNLDKISSLSISDFANSMKIFYSNIIQSTENEYE